MLIFFSVHISDWNDGTHIHCVYGSEHHIKVIQLSRTLMKLFMMKQPMMASSSCFELNCNKMFVWVYLIWHIAYHAIEQTENEHSTSNEMHIFIMKNWRKAWKKSARIRLKNGLNDSVRISVIHCSKNHYVPYTN